MTWEEEKAQESEYLKSIRVEHPELFQKINWTEDAEFLRAFGIHIPGKDTCIAGHIKLFPQDFIVEEVDIEGKCHTVDPTNLLSPTTAIDPSHQTIYATLVKCGLSTIEVVEELCKQIGCKREQIQYSGVKDKRAITSQRISFRNIPIEKIQAVTSSYFFLKDVTGGKGTVEKGRLTGNRFTIFIRTQPGVLELESTKKSLTENIQRIACDGFYNFYYLQRFASPRLRNPEWGLDILKGNYKGAIEGFLTARSERETSFSGNIRDEIKKNLGNWNIVSEILSPLPSFRHERMLVEHLKAHPQDITGALNAIADQVTFWVYGISSLIFNEKLSSYIQNGKVPPKELPTLMSLDRRDTEIYADLMKDLDIYPLHLENVRPFPNIQIKNHKIPTIGKVDFHEIEVLPNGIVLSFTLDKGEYATTFLAHLFNLINGPITEGISDEIVDLQKTMHRDSSSLEYFKKALQTMTGQEE